MQKNKVTVKIMDRDYTVVSEDPREHIQRVANYVDDKMRETYKGNHKLSTAMVGVLSALNIADEYHKLLHEKEELEKRLNSPHYDLKKTREELNEIIGIFTEKTQKYDHLVKAFLKVIDASGDYENDLENLKTRLTKLDSSLKEKEAYVEEDQSTEILHDKEKENH